MLADDYVLGACLYEVGHHGDWRTFRHLGKDHQGNDIQPHRSHRGAQGCAMAPAAMPAAAYAVASRRSRLTIRGRVTLHGFNVAGASVRLVGDQETLGALAGAPWTRPAM